MIPLVLLFSLFSLISGQDANCDYSENVEPGKTYYVYSPGYPQNYTPAVNCRWMAQAQSGYNVRIDCTDFDLPASPSCSGSKLLVSQTGDPQLTDGHSYCGRGTFSLVSTSNSLSIGLITYATSKSGKFMCSLTAVKNANTSEQCRCGWSNKAKAESYPSVAVIAAANTYQPLCSAVIISQRYVMTAAHCVQNVNKALLAVVVGIEDLSKGTSPDARGFAVEGITTHPNYSPNSHDYDIAVLRLQSDILYSQNVGPVCLPFKYANAQFEGKPVTAVGWGTALIGGPQLDLIQSVNFTVSSEASCKEAYPTETARQFCATKKLKTEDTCKVGTAQILYTDTTNSSSQGLLYSVGVLSRGICNATILNTKVTEILNWILNVTPGANYCRK